MSFYDDLLEYANEKNEQISSIVIGELGFLSSSKGKPQYKHIIGKLMRIEDAKEYLDYECDYGYGAPEHHAICAWTQNLIIFVDQYEGATSFVSMPRNPTNHTPEMPGG